MQDRVAQQVGECRAQALWASRHDDPIFRLPYVFANGAPPLWHHGGYRAKGIKHKGRWIVFYHPGDLNDAWKTGHSGAKPKVAESSMHMAVNVIYYAATQYLRQNRSKRR